MDIGLEELEIFKRLAVALAAGFLIGLERGWSDRDEPEGQRMAGIRTFGLIALLGALWSLIYMSTGSWAVVLAFLGFCGLVIMAQWLRSRFDQGLTTPVAAMVTFVLGAIAALGHLSVAAGTAVVVAIILGIKTQVHGWLQRLDEEELLATLKLLLISVVMLPVLPDEGYGPWQALNPYAIWWMVVLVAGISYLGYFATRIAGPRRGILLTAVSGGMVSSTAVTLTLARLQREGRRFDPLFAIGIVLASATMFPRILIWVAVIQPKLLGGILWPLGIMTALSILIAALSWKDVDGRQSADAPHFTPHNPFELKTALHMGALLAAVMILAKALSAWLGETGIYLLAAVSGIGDVDAITLTLSRMSATEIETITAIIAITIASVMNTVTKAALAAGIGGVKLGIYVGLRLSIIIVSGLAGLALAALPLGSG